MSEFEYKDLPFSLQMNWSKYKKLQQIPISVQYDADDTGVYEFERGKKVLICEPFSIVSITRERRYGNEYTELAFYDYSNGFAQIITKQVDTAKLFDKEGINALRSEGFSIVNENRFKTFVASVKANLNRLLAVEIETPVKRYYGSMQYGFEEVAGEINYNNYIGIDTSIIPTKENARFDKVLYKPKGDLKGQLEYLEEFYKDSPCKTLIKVSTAAALTGITRMFLLNKEDMPCPVYNFAARTGFGKSYLEKIEESLFGSNVSTAPVVQSTGTSLAASRVIKDIFGVSPYIDDDWTEMFKRPNGKEEAEDRIYEHSNGTNISKANSNGTLRENIYHWNCPLICFSENNNFMESLKDGSRGRIISYSYEGRDKGIMVYGPISKKSLINKMQDKNYGHIAPAYINALKGLQEEITEQFMDLSGEYMNRLECTDKIASLYAMIDLTYNLAYNFELLPKSWGPLTIEENIGQYDTATTIDSEEDLYNLLRERILSQTNVYINADIKLSKEQYEERMEKNQTVRGRILIQDMEDGRRIKIGIVPTDIVNKNIIDIEKTFGIVNRPISTKAWLKEGWLLPNNRGYAQHNCTNITRQYVKGESKSEYCYKILLEDLTPTPEEKAEEDKIKQQAHEEQLQKDREKLAEIKKKLIPGNEDGLMYKPDNIDNVVA